jgi:outer membrane protein assembly factor BamB
MPIRINPIRKLNCHLLNVALRPLTTFSLVILFAAPAAAQGPKMGGVTSKPTETFTVNPGFRDWGPTAVSGTTIIGGNSSGRGGLFAVDSVTGKLKWSSRPTGLAHGSPFVSTRPAVAGNVVIVPMGNTLIALSLATGKELWRGPKTAQSASVAADAGTAFVLGEDNIFYALDTATGHHKWKVAFTQGRGSCYSQPVVRDGVVYVTGSIEISPATARGPATTYRHLFAFDANTGEERWRYPAKPAGWRDVCLTQPIAAEDGFFAVADETIHALDRTTGRDRWTLEVKRPVEGSVRAVAVDGLVDAGRVLIGMTSGYLIAFEKATGKTAWEIRGQYRVASPSTAVVGGVLYFQGHPGAEPAAEIQDRILYVNGRPVQPVPVLPPGKLNALDLRTQKILWSFSRPTREANWPFGSVTPVAEGLWVDSYQALVKLQ